MNKTTVHKVITNTGYPQVVWSDTLNGRRKYNWMYFRRSDGRFGCSQCPDQIETRQPIIDALKGLDWMPKRDCLSTSPWLMSTIGNAVIFTPPQ